MALLGDEVRFVHDNIRKRARHVPRLQLFEKGGSSEAFWRAKDQMWGLRRNAIEGVLFGGGVVAAGAQIIGQRRGVCGAPGVELAALVLCFLTIFARMS